MQSALHITTVDALYPHGAKITMQSALHITTKVLPGHKIEIQIPPGSVGEEVEVFVVLSEALPKQQAAIDILNQLPGQQQFKTAEAVDRYLKEERDLWER
ncbi:MAG: hypothetical protein KME45_22210 [Stenomitos rutilans HA7619-LM2]|jgi:hypothetical protein|nr:hypothetical protein [Stenomitos rutilans HA7619-LM2]